MDEDDLIVVDDGDDDYSPAGPSTQPIAISNPAVHSGTGMSTRRRSTAGSTSYSAYMDSSERTTRSAAKLKSQPKLKLKLSEKAAAQAPGMSFLGPYDRELDSDDEDLTFEEQFILRMPAGDDCERLRKMVATREISNDVWFKFKGKTSLLAWKAYSRGCGAITDARRAVFHIGNSTYSSKLVDLPCIIESQKTLDNKQMFKVADICQVTRSIVKSFTYADKEADARGRRSDSKRRFFNQPTQLQRRRIYLATRYYASASSCTEASVP
jgi:transcription initiation factor TFIID subunit 7